MPAIRDMVGSLAEVFCLTDPGLPDNPIIYASEGKLELKSMQVDD